LLGIAIGLYLLFAIVVVDQWEKVAVLRFGRYRGLRGPGLFLIIPIIETLSRYVDQRVRVHGQRRIDADARYRASQRGRHRIFWLVWNAEKSILEVEDFTQAITLSAQTALRESIGRHSWRR
jgi:regulator of protease activity HflC (stomatin/prohibitin superfamily)